MSRFLLRGQWSPTEPIPEPRVIVCAAPLLTDHQRELLDSIVNAKSRPEGWQITLGGHPYFTHYATGPDGEELKCRSFDELVSQLG